MIKIFTANTAFEADQIQALLKSYDIPCIIKNDVSNLFTGASSIGYQDIYVSEEQEAAAREILNDMPIIKNEIPESSAKKRWFVRILILAVIAVGVLAAVMGQIL